MRWLITGFVAAAHSCIIFGAAGKGKSSVVRALVAELQEGRDPFGTKVKESTPNQHRVVWYTEEPIEQVKLQFEAQNVDLDRVDLLDTSFLWNDRDLVDEEMGEFVYASPFTQLCSRIDAKVGTDERYVAVVVDPLSMLFRDSNKGHEFDLDYNRFITPLERRGLAVIMIGHPRKDSPKDAPLSASLKGTERLFSRPRLVSAVMSENRKQLMAQDTRERVKAQSTLHPPLIEFEEAIDGETGEHDLWGVLAPLKNSYAKPESLRARHYSITGEKEGEGKVRFSDKAWEPGMVRESDKPFGEAVTEHYRIHRREKMTAQEKQAHENNLDRDAQGESMRGFIENLAKEHQLGISTAELRQEIENAGFNWGGGQRIRVFKEFFSYDHGQKMYIPKQKDSFR